MENIIWKDAKGFEGYYEVSRCGMVRRKKNETIYKDGRVANFSQTILKPSENPKGYLRVYLSVRSKKITKNVHRIVAETFINNPENKKTVNHKNSNKKDNRVENLEWMTNKENMQHAFKNGAFKERDKTTIKNLGKFADGSKGAKNHNAILNESKVMEIRELRNKGLRPSEIAKIFNIKIERVSSICNRRSWKHI